ncbi:hypothetical protein ABQE93_22695 [Mycolicibacterium sp. XJ662]
MSAVDEAFLPLAELLPGLLPALPDLYDSDAGVRSRVTGLEVETPVELDIAVAADGRVRLGAVPPLYHLETSVLPVFHAVRLVAVRDGYDEKGAK